MMIDAGVDFDITSWHWYSEMGDLTNTSGPHVDVLSHLVALGKPIWVTEMNRRGGSVNASEQLQAGWIKHELDLLVLGNC